MKQFKHKKFIGLALLVFLVQQQLRVPEPAERAEPWRLAPARQHHLELQQRRQLVDQ